MKKNISINEELTSSSLNYIKAIYAITENKPAARVKDIAKHLGISASSVSEAIKSLSEKGFIDYEPYGIINLSQKGMEIAIAQKQRHKVLKSFLQDVLVVSDDLAETSANDIENTINDEVLKKLVNFIEFMQTCSCKEPKWIKSFKHYTSNNGELSDNCKNCIETKKQHPELNNNSCCGISKTYC